MIPVGGGGSTWSHTHTWKLRRRRLRRRRPQWGSDARAGWDGRSALDVCKELLAEFRIPEEMYQIGRTKLFFRAGVLGHLEDTSARLNRRAAAPRGYLEPSNAHCPILRCGLTQQSVQMCSSGFALHTSGQRHCARRWNGDLNLTSAFWGAGRRYSARVSSAWRSAAAPSCRRSARLPALRHTPAADRCRPQSSPSAGLA